MLPERDIFDIAVAAELDADALSAAVNHLDVDYRREIVHRIRAQAEQYRNTAKTVLNPLDAQSQPLLENAPARAAAARARPSWIRRIGQPVPLAGPDQTQEGDR